MNYRLRVLLLVLLGVVGFKVATELYRWHAYRPEREQIAVLREQLVDAGADLVRTELRADTLQQVIEREDGRLKRRQAGLAAYGRRAEGGALPAALYHVYRAELRAYNRLVEQRNARWSEWKQLRARNRLAVDRYNTLADSIRQLARRMGEPYISLPLPAEAAVERGLAGR